MSGNGPIIALLGPRGCGKSTIANLLSAHGFEIVSFASPLRKLAALFGSECASNRGLLLDMGRVLRESDPDFFLRAMAGQLNSTSNPVVIDDLRFPSEYDWLKRKKAHIIRLTIDEETQLARIMNRDSMTHVQAKKIISCADEGQLQQSRADITLKSEGEFTDLVSTILSFVKQNKEHSEYNNSVV